MKGYKALNQDMTTKYGNMTYEIGKTYHMNENPILCDRGYHFCEKLEQIQAFYDIGKSRIFEIEATGEVIFSEDKCVTNEITLVRELSKNEIKQYFKDNLDELINHKNWTVRCEVAKQGYGLDILVNDEDRDVRCEVAKQGYGLDILVNDEDWRVRCAVAEQGYGLDILIKDKDWSVRRAVAEQGYGLDILIKDKDWRVRYAVAKQGYGLDILINDEDWLVRCKVAKQGYGLDILVNDKDWRVRRTAESKLKELS